MNRREFLATAALGSVVTLLVAACDQHQDSWRKIAFEPPSSGEITRLALLNDAAALARQETDLPQVLKDAVTGLPGLPHILGMGMLLPVGVSVIPFLAKARSSWIKNGWRGARSDRIGAENDAHRVAIATGYLLHRAADSRLSQGYMKAGIGAANIDQARLYQDATVLRSRLSEPPPTRAEAEAMLFVLDQRLRIKIHTLIPDADEKSWVAKLLAWDSAQEALFKAIAAAMTEPNRDDLARYVDDLNFFSPASSLVVAARSQSTVSGPALSKPTASKPALPQGSAELVTNTQLSVETSLYGQALADCMQVIAGIKEFLEGSIDEETFAGRIA